MSTSETDENDPVRTFVHNALQAKEHGNSFQYDVVVQQMRRREDPETICRVVVVMENFASYLSNRSDLFQDLLHAIFSYDWKGEDRMNMAMMDLIIAIISCNVTFAKLAYRGFVHTFFQPDLAQKEPEEDEESRKKRFDCIHDGVRAISSQVPMSTTNLFDELRANFPHKRFAHRVQAEYLQHCLRICDAIPRIRDKLLDLIVTKCLEIDVEIVIEDSGEAHVEQDTASGVDTAGNTTAQTSDTQKHADERLTSPESNGDDLSSQHFFSSLQDQHGSSINNTKSNITLSASTQKQPIVPSEESKTQQAVQESADKLDAMLSHIVDYIAAQSPSAKSSTARSTSHYLEFWPILLKIFEKRLLVTPKAKFVQFIFFYATTALQPKVFAESFCRRLLVVAFDLSAPIAVRLSATMYLASFVARANVLSLPLVRDIVREMLEWCVMYVLVYRADPHYPQPANAPGMDVDDPSGDHENSNNRFHADPVNSLTTLVKRRLKKKFATLREHAKEELTKAQQYQQQQWQRQQQQQKHQRGTLSTSSSYSRLSDAASQISGLSSLSPHNNLASPSNANMNNNQTVMELDEYGRLQVKESSIRQHIVFYAMAQAIAYILCFYGISLIDSFSPAPSQNRKMSGASDNSQSTKSRKRKHSEDESELLFSTSVDEPTLEESNEEYEKHVALACGLEIVFGSRFEPLRYVMTSIRYEFFRLAIHKQLFPPAMWLCHLSPDYMNFENDLVDDTASMAHTGDQENGHRKRQEDERNKIINNSILQYYYNLQRSLEEENDDDRDGGKRSKKSLKGSDDEDDDNDDVRSVVSGLSYSSRMSLFSSASMYSRSSVSTVAYAQSVWSAPSFEENGYQQNYASSGAGHGSHAQNNSSMHFYQQQQYQELMENFFPFDPCLLRALHDKIASYYREWEGVPGLPQIPAMRSRNNSEILGDSVVLGEAENDEGMDDENEDMKSKELEEESDIDEDDDGRLLGEDEDIDSDALPDEEDEEAVIASGAMRILKAKPKPPLISRMDPTHPLLSGGFFLANQNPNEESGANSTTEIEAVVKQPQVPSPADIETQEHEDDQHAKKKRRKDKKDKKRRSSVELVPNLGEEDQDMNDFSMIAEDVPEERVSDVEDNEEERLRKKKEKKEKKKKEKKEKKEKRRSLAAAEEISEMDTSVLDKEEDTNSDHFHSTNLTSSALQQHVLNSHHKLKQSAEKQHQSSNMQHIHSNPVVDRFLREQQQQLAASARKGKPHSGSVPSSAQKNGALYYVTPHKDIYVQQKGNASGSRVNYDDLPQPEFSPMQQQMFDYRGNFVRQVSELPHSNTKHTPHSQHDDDFEQEYGADHQLLYEENLAMHQIGGGGGGAGSTGDEDNMGRSSRPRQYSITSTGSW